MLSRVLFGRNIGDGGRSVASGFFNKNRLPVVTTI